MKEPNKVKEEEMRSIRFTIPGAPFGKQRHRIRPMKKPDWDNIGKIVCDSLNKIAYHDDSRVVDAQVRKFYSENPRVDVTIRKIDLREI